MNDMVKPNFPVFSSGIIGLKPFVTERVASIKAQLAGEKEGYKIEHMPEAGEGPSPPQRSQEEVEAIMKMLEAQLEQINASIETKPTDPELYVKKGEILGGLVEVGGATAWMKYGNEMSAAFEKAIQLDPENVGGHMGRGMIRFFTPEMFGGDLDGAISDLEFVLSKEPDSGEANFVIGLAYNRKGLKDKAIAHLEKVLELDPQNQEAKKQLEQLKQ